MPPEWNTAWLREMIDRPGWSRARLARALGHRDTKQVRRWLDGQRPHLDTVPRIYEALGSTPPERVDDERTDVDLLADVRRDVREVLRLVTLLGRDVQALAAQQAASPGEALADLTRQMRHLARTMDSLTPPAAPAAAPRQPPVPRKRGTGR